VVAKESAKAVPTSHADLKISLGAKQDCFACTDAVAERVRSVAGVQSVTVHRGADAGIGVDFDDRLMDRTELARIAHSAETEVSQRFGHSRIEVKGLDCPSCASSVEASISSLAGITGARLTFATGTLDVEFDRELCRKEQIVERLRQNGYEIGQNGSSRRATFTIGGLDCADCARSLEAGIQRLRGVESATVNFATGTMQVEHHINLTAKAIADETARLGYQANLAGPMAARTETDAPFLPQNRRALAVGVAGGLILLAVLVQLTNLPIWVSQIGFGMAILIAGFHPARSGFYTVIRARTLDMNALMAIAAIGAAALGEWAEGAIVVFLFGLGNLLESYTVDRARRALTGLAALVPPVARVIRGEGGERYQAQVPIEDVSVGDVVGILPGERVPIDGVVVAGSSATNEAQITGESAEVPKRAGDPVFAGSLNVAGYLEVQSNQPYADNTVNRISRLVAEAQSRRAPSQRLIDSFAAIYTPAVMLLAALIVVVPTLVFGEPFVTWFYRALVILVISCPCALVISTPVTIVSALTRAARDGILFKGGEFVEVLGQVRAVAFDKTGTATSGEPSVSDVIPATGVSTEHVTLMAVSVEQYSEHPVARAVLRHARHLKLRPTPATDFIATPGEGARATVDGRIISIGHPGFGGIPAGNLAVQAADLARGGRTLLVVSIDGEVIGLIGVLDQPRAEARQAVTRLHELGIRPVLLLSGDQPAAVAKTARDIGADDFQGGLLPADKLEAIHQLQIRYGPVAMVGDGVNDAPALASARVGVAMGVAGTATAIETAPVALMSDNLTHLADAIVLSRQARRIITANVAFSIGIKVLFLALAVSGLATLWLAIAADMGASLLVTLNGMRLLRARGE
jgi:Zn2+/Cd2+-exporting ATPase